VAIAGVSLLLGICLIFVGCLGRRLTAAEVVRRMQASLDERGACHSILDLDIDTDLLKESVSLEVWEQGPRSRKVRVLSAVNPQLQGMAFATDGDQSMLYFPHVDQFLVGPVNRVRMPLVLEVPVEGGAEWLRLAGPETATIVAKERADGLVMYEVQVPLSAGGYARYSVDARQWWVREIEYEDAYVGWGQLRVREVSCHLDMAPSQFALDVPSDVSITEVSTDDNRLLTIEEAQMSVPFPLREPGYLPEGTEFREAYPLGGSIAMEYVGEKPFTLIQGPGISYVPREQATLVALRGQQATAIRDREHGGWELSWREDGLQFSVAGTLEQKEIIRIAESLQPVFKDAEGGQNADRAIDRGR
jgi:hypothetical protein